MRRHKDAHYTEFEERILARVDGEGMTPFEELSQEDRDNVDCLLNGPEQYGVEREMLAYLNAHENATFSELIHQFDILVDGMEPPDFGDDDDDE
jgi:hypothetical protein